MKRKTALLFILLIIATSFLFLFSLGQEALMDYDEAGYAQIVREAVISHNYIIPYLDGSPWFDKPPLQFWAAESLYKAGLPIEWAVRLPGAVLGIATVLILFLLVFEITENAWVGLMTGLIVATTGDFLMTSREFKLDVPVTFFLVLSVYCFIKARKNPQWLIGIGASLGLAIMTKSVIGLFVIPIIIAFALSEWKWQWFKNIWLWWGSLIGLIIALPWHIYEYILYGQSFINGYFIFNVVERYQTAVVENSANVGTYLWTLWTFNNPWFLLFLVSIAYLGIRFNYIDKNIRGVITGSVLSVVGLFIVFSTAHTIIPYYLVTLYPFIALTVGLVLFDAYKTLSKNWQKGIFIVLFIIITINALIGAIHTGYHLDKPYNIEHTFASEEKNIGTILLSTPATTVYFDDDLYNLTVRYYSAKQIDVLDKNNLPERPFYLVIFLQKAYDESYYQNLLKNAEPLYKGEYIGLYKVK